MLCSELVASAFGRAREFGDMKVLLQADDESNSYSYASGVGTCYVTNDLQTTFDDLAEAEEYGLYEDDLTKVLVIYP